MVRSFNAIAIVLVAVALSGCCDNKRKTSTKYDELVIELAPADDATREAFASGKTEVTVVGIDGYHVVHPDASATGDLGLPGSLYVVFPPSADAALITRIEFVVEDHHGIVDVANHELELYTPAPKDSRTTTSQCFSGDRIYDRSMQTASVSLFDWRSALCSASSLFESRAYAMSCDHPCTSYFRERLRFAVTLNS